MRKSRLTILHVGPVGANRHQGLFYAIPGLVRAQHMCGADVVLLTTNPESRYLQQEAFPVLYYRDTSFQNLIDPSATETKFNLIIFHSTYLPSQARMARLANERRIPYIIVPHGGMTQGAMSVKKWKKRIGNLCFFSRMVQSCAALHFLTENEAAKSLSWGRPFFVVGNGIEIPAFRPKIHCRHEASEDCLEFIFVGRLSLKEKGIDLLLDGFARYLASHPDARIRLRLFGPDGGGEAHEVVRHLHRRGLESWAKLEGPIYGRVKQEVLGSADVFVLTSRFEGHPIAVLEALAAGLPCLLTPETNMAEEVRRSGAGWCVSGDPEAVAEGLTAAFQARDRLPAMGEKGRAMAKNRYSWEAVGHQTLIEYRKVLSSEGGESFVCRPESS